MRRDNCSAVLDCWLRCESVAMMLLSDVVLVCGSATGWINEQMYTAGILCKELSSKLSFFLTDPRRIFD